MSLRARLVLLCAAFLAFALVASGGGAVLVLRANDARRDRQEIATAAAEAMALESTYVRQAAAVRSYFLTGDAGSFDDYNEQRYRAGDIALRLRGLLAGTGLVARMQTVIEANRIWRDEALLPLINLEQQGRGQEVIDQYRTGTAVTAFQRLADALQDLRTDLETALERATTRQNDSRSVVARYAVGAFLATIASLFIMSLIGRMWITRPINQLSRAIRSDDPKPARLPKRGASEIALLAEDVAAMRGRLHDEMDRATRTREGLSQNAAVLMSLRAQLETSPDALPVGWSVAAQLVPATGIVAGDCYTVDIVGREHMTIVVVDVAGHGAASAVAALRAKELLRAAVRSYDDPSDAVTWASSQLTDLGADMFVTAFVARVDFNSGLVRFVNAGHPEALVCDGVNVVGLGPSGPLIGPFEGAWTTREAIIGPGQMLVCYTDGLVEVRNQQREEFGVDRLTEVLRENYGDETDSIVKQCLSEADAFSHGRAHDDITLTIIARAILS